MHRFVFSVKIILANGWLAVSTCYLQTSVQTQSSKTVMQKILREDAKSMPSTGTISSCCAFNRARRLKLRPGTPVQASSRIPKTRSYPPTGRVSTVTHPWPNPIAGPVYVEGTERGDLLVAYIEDIEVEDYSWIAVGPMRGPFGESTRWPELSSEYTTKIFRHPPVPVVPCAMAHFNFSDDISQLAHHAVHWYHQYRTRPWGNDKHRRPRLLGR